MTANVGNLDRGVRFVLGIALILLPFFTSFALWETPLVKIAAVLVGAVLVVTAGMRFCPLYRLIGANTCRT